MNTKGKDLANAPDQYAVAVDDVRLPPEWQVGTGIFYSSSRFGNNANTSQVPSYVRWDLTGAYQINKNAGVRLNIQNMMDTTYYDQVHPGHVIPGDGRTFILSGNFTF